MGCGPALYSLALYSQVKAQGRSKQSLLRHEDLVCSPSHGLWACIVITSFVQPGKEETRRGQAIAGKECEWLAWVCVPMLLAVPMAGPQLPELKSSNVLLPSKSQQPLSHYWTKKEAFKGCGEMQCVARSGEMESPPQLWCKSGPDCWPGQGQKLPQLGTKIHSCTAHALDPQHTNQYHPYPYPCWQAAGGQALGTFQTTSCAPTGSFALQKHQSCETTVDGSLNG
eukprot:1145275-Pelagomonas_calceolata.AAC.3